MKKRTYIGLIVLILSDFAISIKVEIAIYTILSLFFLFSNDLKIRKIIIKLSIWLFIPIIWALFQDFNLNRDLMRSIFYLIIPILIFYLGSNFNFKQLPRFFIFYSTLSVLIYILISIYNGNISNFLNPEDARLNTYFRMSILCCISIFLLIFNNISLLFRQNFRVPILLVNLLGLFIASSRTNFVLLISFFLVYYLMKSKKRNIILTVFIILPFVVINLYGNLEEIFKEILFLDSTSTESIGLSYRGFENYQAWKNYISGSSMQKLFGYGLTQNIQLDTTVELGGKLFDEIPILHNAFIYLLYRTGLFGMIFYSVFFYLVSQKIIGFQNIFIFNISLLALILSSIVVGGFFNLEYGVFWFLIGSIACNNYKNND